MTFLPLQQAVAYWREMTDAFLWDSCAPTPTRSPARASQPHPRVDTHTHTHSTRTCNNPTPPALLFAPAPSFVSTSRCTPTHFQPFPNHLTIGTSSCLNYRPISGRGKQGIRSFFVCVSPFQCLDATAFATCLGLDLLLAFKEFCHFSLYSDSYAYDRVTGSQLLTAIPGEWCVVVWCTRGWYRSTYFNVCTFLV